MGRYIPNAHTIELLLEIEAKEAQLRAQEIEHALVLSRLEGLEVSGDTRAIFQRYVNGELTIAALDAAIYQHLNLRANTPENERP
jgi:Antitoxin VbhA